jgi:hypothetical protein
MSEDPKLRELWNKQEIAEVLGARYARALDWLDEEALKDCFHPDGHVDYGFFVGNAHDWCIAVMPIEKESLHRFHYVFNILIRIEGDTAEAESNSLAGGRRSDGAGGFTQSFFGSRYLDRLERRGGVWKIAERRALLEFAQEMPSSGGPGGGLAGLELVSGLSPQHALYRPMRPHD